MLNFPFATLKLSLTIWSMQVPRNMKLIAVPLFEIHDHSQRYGPVISNIPALVSRLTFALHGANIPARQPVPPQQKQQPPPLQNAMDVYWWFHIFCISILTKWDQYRSNIFRTCISNARNFNAGLSSSAKTCYLRYSGVYLARFCYNEAVW